MFTWNCPSCSQVHFKKEEDLPYINWNRKGVCAHVYCPKSLNQHIIILDPVKCIGCMRPWLCSTKVLINAT